MEDGPYCVTINNQWKERSKVLCDMIRREVDDIVSSAGYHAIITREIINAQELDLLCGTPLYVTIYVKSACPESSTLCRTCKSVTS